jgi:ketosteroid isomerase-like protein
MRNAFLIVALLCGSSCGCAHTKQQVFDADAVVRECLAADARYSEAASRGDYQAMAEFVTPDFVYIDISGNRMTPELMLARRSADHRVVLNSEVLGEEVIALAGNIVVMRLHERTLSHYYGGLPRRSESRSTFIWVRGADNQWRMQLAQANIVQRPAFPVKVRRDLSAQQLRTFAGTYKLQHQPGLTFIIRASEDALYAEIPGEFTDMAFYAEGEREFFASARPFELRFNENADELTLITWGNETPGVRLGE